MNSSVLNNLFRIPLSALLLAVSLFSMPLQAAEIRVAVASNFLLPLTALARRYQQETGDKVVISAGSTGKLYAQIVNGAPYDVFLAANEREPARLEKEGYAISGSRFTYARGKLALWDPKGLHQQATVEEVLQAGDYQRLALANPLTAPYGAAALEVLKKLKLDSSTGFKILRGENVSQAYQYAASGAADLGFVALSQLQAVDVKPPGNYWLANENMYSPILQQAVLLKSAQQDMTSKGRPSQSFLNYLQSPKVQAMIEQFGYAIQ
jgi:molybdate transport system substrate-binding protein